MEPISDSLFGTSHYGGHGLPGRLHKRYVVFYICNNHSFISRLNILEAKFYEETI